MVSITASGKTWRSPAAMFSATSRASSEPLNLSGAMRILIADFRLQTSDWDSWPQSAVFNLQSSIIFLRRVLERLLDVELLHLLHQGWIVGRFEDAAVLQKVENAPLPDQIGDFRI